MRRPNLSLGALQKPQTRDKYAGEADDPHFIPSSPIIERRRLSAREEAELSRACATALTNIQSADEEDPSPLARKQESQKSTKHDKHASFTFSAPKTMAKEAMPANRHSTGIRPRPINMAAEVMFEPLEPSHTKVSRRSNPRHHDPERQALYEIRSKLDQRPKTSAAACIDYTDDGTSSSSNWTSRTTPFTSAGITPASTSKRFSELAVEGIEPVPPVTADPLQMDPEVVDQARSWLADEFARRRQKDEQATHGQNIESETRGRYAQPYQPNTVHQRPVSRGGSMRNSIKQYIRPGSSHADSVRSVATGSSTRSQMRSAFNGLRDRLSRKRSSSMSSFRRGRDRGNEYYINASQANVNANILNRPLPALPGLDTYVEPKPRHLAELFARPNKTFADEGANKIITDDGAERLLSYEEVAKRKEEMSRAVLEKMTTGSIGSGGVTSPTQRLSVQTKRSSANPRDDASASRPVTQGSARTRPMSTQSLTRVMDEDFGANQQQRQRWRQRMSQNIVPQGKLGDVTVVNSITMTAPATPSRGKRHSGQIKDPFLKRIFRLGKSKPRNIPAF